MDRLFHLGEGAALDASQGALTQSMKDTTLRYIRRNTAKIGRAAAERA